ncbi:MAG: hypothetical protein QOI98_1868, partial [Solirubrobacteraceae bacterium]|nr:hypothetical protein [Solirubrobacteraceae bacterium]
CQERRRWNVVDEGPCPESAVSVIVAEVEAVDVRRMRLVLGLAAG